MLACLKTGFEAFVNAGSSSEYGLKDHPPTEMEPLEPNSYYAVAKASATMFCTFTARNTGTSISTLRLYSVYGPYEEPTRLMPTLIREGFENRLPPLVNPDTARDFVYVDDVVKALVAAASASDVDRRVINVGTGRETSINDLADLVAQVTHKQVEVLRSPAESGGVSRLCADVTVARQLLGYKPRVNLAEGLRLTLECDPRFGG